MCNREYPEFPLIGVGGVVIDAGRVLLVRRATEPARGEWTIPGGLLETGETLTEGVARELREETALTVRVVELIEVLERIFPGETTPPSISDNKAAETTTVAEARPRPRFHYVILDYLCELVSGEPQINDELTDIAFAREDELERYRLTEVATRVVRKAFRMAREGTASQ